jgi:CIC family chloride channel protein
LLPEFSIPAFIPLLIAAAAASVVGRFFNYQQLFFLNTGGWEVKAVLFYVILASFIGVFSIFVTKLTYFIKGAFKKIKNVYTRVLIGGLILGLLIFIFPTLYGEGYVTVSRLLAGDYQSIVKNSIFADYSSVPLWIIIFSILTIFAKSAATLVTLGAGGNGGVFGPSLIMGGLFGFVFSFAINQTGLVHLNVSNFIVAGMAAALSGIMHAPLTGIFLIAEITGGYVLMVPLMIVSSISYFISKVSQKHSIYTKILAEKGELLSHEDKDSTVLRMLKLKYLIETNFVKFNVDEDPLSRSNEIIHSNRNVFPVIDNENKLAGIVYSEHLFEVIVDRTEGVRISDLMQPVPDFIHVNESMVQVMNKMEKDDVWLLPVVNSNSEYLGFVSKTAIFNKYRALLIRQKNYLQ